MHIAFLSDALAKKNRYGLSRYALELHAGLSRVRPDLELTPVFAHVEVDPAELRTRCGGPYRTITANRRALAIQWSTLGLPRLEHWVPEADVVHSVELAYPVATKRPWVVTVHDLGPITHPHYFSASRIRLKRMAFKRAFRDASAVIAVSSATRDAVVDVGGEGVGRRPHVVPEGVSDEFFTPVGPDVLQGLRGLPEAGAPFFMWVGAKLNPRKNLRRVVQAFDAVAGDVPHHLVLVGGIGWDTGPDLAQVERSPYRDRIHQTGYVTDEQLRGLYAAADAFLYVSLFEGFGLPILEAMAAGCPVIASSVSSMPEVAGDAGLLANPEDVRSIATQMERVARDGALREALRGMGRERAQQFRWDSCASAVADVYDGVLR